MSDLNLAPQGAGPLEKMRASVQDDGTVSYALPLGEQTVPLNPLLGARLQLRFEQAIFCTACGRKTNKSFNQGYCYPCFQRLAACDSCIVSPEKCHFAAGTCREPDWAERFCMTDHLVYLANSTGLKVGITRVNQVPTRWIDQGASAAVLFARTQTRHLAGLVEVILKAHVADRTQWQRLLKGPPEPVDLLAARDELWQRCAPELAALQGAHGLAAVQRVTGPERWSAHYPVLAYPAKVKALALEKLGTVEGTLEGIKGQYLLLSSGVINIRKYTAHQVSLFTA
jgi:hypothetical protein